MAPRLKFDVIYELRDIVFVEETEETKKRGLIISQTITDNGYRREAIVALLQGDSEIMEALNGHNIDFAVLTSATLGMVTDDFSNLILRKVRKVLGIILQ